MSFLQTGFRVLTSISGLFFGELNKRHDRCRNLTRVRILLTSQAKFCFQKSIALTNIDPQGSLSIPSARALSY
jgi:hypothetical protein